jgi:hypothetical protein
LYNSYHELESDYEKLSNTTMGTKSWSIGPVSAWIIHNQNDEVLVIAWERRHNSGSNPCQALGVRWSLQIQCSLSVTDSIIQDCMT